MIIKRALELFKLEIQSLAFKVFFLKQRIILLTEAWCYMKDGFQQLANHKPGSSQDAAAARTQATSAHLSEKGASWVKRTEPLWPVKRVSHLEPPILWNKIADIATSSYFC